MGCGMSDDGPVPEAVLEELCAMVVQLSDGELTRGDLDPSAPIVDRGYVDSLSAVMLLDGIRARWGVEIEDVELIESLTTLVAIAKRVDGAG
jgi:acyl carrier protein